MSDVEFSVGANACVNGFCVLRRYRTVRAARARARRGYENLLAMTDGDLYDDDCGRGAEER